ncbi:MAG: TetR/AcrR family transcriptional regulator [Planctomycetota bacterium]|nr:TetR/AcrR family transcriptional regulator [Planctomycetota bacterium]
MPTVASSVTNHDTAKHDAILNQAILIFAADGFARGDVQTIANAAGVGKGTVYRYFGNKLDLFYACTFAVGKRLSEHFVNAIEQEHSPIKKLRAAAMAYANFFVESPEYLELLVQERAEFRDVKPEAHYQYHNSIIDEFSDIFQAAIDAGEIRPVEIRKTLIAMSNVLFGSVTHTLCHVLPEGSTETPATLAEYAIDLFIRGLRVNPLIDIQDESEQRVSG